MSFRRFDFAQNQRVRKSLYSDGGSIQGNLKVSGSSNLNNIKINGSLTDAQGNTGNYGSILTTNPSNGDLLWSYQGNQYEGSDFFPSDFWI